MVPQSLSILAIPDEIDRGIIQVHIINIMGTSLDSEFSLYTVDGTFYDQLWVERRMRVFGDDNRAILVSDLNPVVMEGLIVALNVSLQTQPYADVTLTLFGGSTVDVFSPVSALVFSSNNWHIPQQLPLVGVHDRYVCYLVSY